MSPTDFFDHLIDGYRLKVLWPNCIEELKSVQLEQEAYDKKHLCFNIVDIFGIENQEVKHSQFLTWLLSPSASHGQGTLFLKKYLKTIGLHEKYDEATLTTAVVNREVWLSKGRGRLDIEIRIPNKLLVFIENKMEADDHTNQLQNYSDALGEQRGSYSDVVLIYMTLDGKEPNNALNGQACKLTLLDIHQFIKGIQQLNFDDTKLTIILNDYCAYMNEMR